MSPDPTAQTPAVESLAAEVDALSDVLSDFGGEDWSRPTPAVGWDVSHQVAHLITVFRLATMAASEPDRFRSALSQMSDDLTANVQQAMAPLVALGNEALASLWLETSERCVEVFRAIDGRQIVPWLVNDIPADVLAMAGTAETFAHGQDIRDAFGATRWPSDHIRAVCEFAYHTRLFGYAGQGLQPPAQLPLQFALVSPSGATWTIGDADTDNVVSGPAWDLALLVTRRRDVDDLDLVASNPTVQEWMSLAQAYRGPGGPGRRPLEAKAA